MRFLKKCTFHSVISAILNILKKIVSYFMEKVQEPENICFDEVFGVKIPKIIKRKFLCFHAFIYICVCVILVRYRKHVFKNYITLQILIQSL